MSGSRVRGDRHGDPAVASDAVLVKVCDGYWSQVHRRYFVKIEPDASRAIAKSLGKWAMKALRGQSLPAIVERLQRQGLVLARIQIDATGHGKTVELVTSVQPTQVGLDRAEAIRAAAKAKAKAKR